EVDRRAIPTVPRDHDRRCRPAPRLTGTQLPGCGTAAASVRIHAGHMILVNRRGASSSGVGRVVDTDRAWFDRSNIGGVMTFRSAASALVALVCAAAVFVPGGPAGAAKTYNPP